MGKLSDTEGALFDQPLYAVAATVLNTAEGRAKPKHIRRNSNVGILLMQDPYKWVAVSGPAELTTEGADEQIDRLAKKYLDADSYPWRDPAEKRVTVRVKPERVDSAGLNGDG